MRKTIAVIGEGITEKYYVESLKGLTPFTLLPQELGKKASSLSSLEKHILKAIKDGYDEVYCLIDMDNKSEGKNRSEYLKLKVKYHNKQHLIKSKGFNSKVVFVETERCLELWFLYHFVKYPTTQKFSSYKELELELRKYRNNYGKHERYFRSIGNIHEEFILKKPQGSLRQAIRNSEISMASREEDSRDYTYSEMAIFIKALGIAPD